jgi:hypothetical protein
MTLTTGKKRLNQHFDIRKRILNIDEPGTIGVLDIDTDEVKLYKKKDEKFDEKPEDTSKFEGYTAKEKAEMMLIGKNKDCRESGSKTVKVQDIVPEIRIDAD